MGKRRRTVRQLADEAKLDADTAIVLLWDAGFGKLLNPNDIIHRGDLNRARRALGLATRRELETGRHWMEMLKMAEPEFGTLLEELGIPPEEQTQKLPHKAISRLKGEARRRGIDPVTGGAVAWDIPTKESKGCGTFSGKTSGCISSIAGEAPRTD